MEDLYYEVLLAKDGDIIANNNILTTFFNKKPSRYLVFFWKDSTILNADTKKKNATEININSPK